MWESNFKQSIPGVTAEKKRLSWLSTFGLIEIEERIWRSATASYQRPLPSRLGITPCGRSRALTRALSDFGIEHSFQQAASRFQEHYGFEIAASTVRTATLETAARASAKLEAQYEETFRILPAQGAEYILGEADGTMICTVEAAKRGDKHPRQWKEMRLVAGREQGKQDAINGGGFINVEQAGQRWGHCVRDAGWAMNSTVHALNDGAVWIDHQVDQVFGPEVSKLCDFFHVCEYIAAAAKGIAPDQVQPWSELQRKRLKESNFETVIAELATHLEPSATPEDNAPVTAAWRYLSNRRNSLDYARALENDLPIGSGLIESGRKHVLHARLKKVGSAWLESSAHLVSQLRILRSNKQWSILWN